MEATSLGVTKLKIDGLVVGNPGQASVQGLLRDSNVVWIRGFYCNIGITNSLAVELWGLRDGLTLARKVNICKLIIEIDAKLVVDLINSVDYLITLSHPYSALIADCRLLIQSFEQACLLHIHHEGSFCIDLLTKAQNNALESFLEFISPTSFVVSQLMTDMGGFLPSCM